MNQAYLEHSTRLTLVTECYYIFNYKDHRDFSIVNMLHITLISLNGVVCLDQLSGAWYCIFLPANGCLLYTHISYHDRRLSDGEKILQVQQHPIYVEPVEAVVPDHVL